MYEDVEEDVNYDDESFNPYFNGSFSCTAFLCEIGIYGVVSFNPYFNGSFSCTFSQAYAQFS
ncbi:hypothetical protein [Terrisporobacter sp.]|uniref:hypothetical protein n=1 Tax=Terrisporobacter sp. TaxID=1965305 RepID=UPI003FCE6111